jgi:predicted secreted protein
MAIHKGSEGVIKVGANTVAEVKNYSVEETGDTVETTSLGDSARTFTSTLTSWSASVDAFWDETDTTGQGALTIGAEVTLNVYPEGADTGDTYYAGSAIVTGVSISGSFDGTVDASISLQGTGALTSSTA